MIRRALALLLLVGWILPIVAQHPAPTDVPRTLDLARQAIEAQRYDQALKSLRPIIADPDVDPALRIEALILHARANAARGKFEDADNDWRQVLRARPDFEPPPATLSAKAKSRFRAVRASVIGNVRILVDPLQADVSIDGFPVRHIPQESIALPTGAHVIAASAAGFDPAEQTMAVAGGQELEVRLELVPNAGVLVIRTIPDGVTVRLDGEPVGVTAGAPAELRLDTVQLGEHRIELDKPCHRSTAFDVSVVANLLDHAPRVVGPIELAPAMARIELRNGPGDAEVFLDGARAGKLAEGTFARCPGPTRIEVRSGARLLWAESAELSPDTDVTIDVKPRPNVALYGAEAWPGSLARLGSTLGWQSAGDLPPGANAMTPQGWSGVTLAPDVDLAVAFLRDAKGGQSRWIVMSPVLGTVSPLVAAVEADPPRWLEGDLGIVVVDSRIGGIARVVRVTPERPAARAGIEVGERVVEVAGHPLESAEQFQGAIDAALDAAHDGTTVALRVERRSGGSRVVQLERRSRARRADAAGAARDAVVAAWARVAAATSAPDEAAGALANLATLQARGGWHRQAAATWDAALRLGSGSLCRGTAAYHRGIELDAQGPSAEATDAFRIAAESSCAAFGAPEVLVAPAARSRLALGAPPTFR